MVATVNVAVAVAVAVVEPPHLFRSAIARKRIAIRRAVRQHHQVVRRAVRLHPARRAAAPNPVPVATVACLVGAFRLDCLVIRFDRRRTAA